MYCNRQCCLGRRWARVGRAGGRDKQLGERARGRAGAGRSGLAGVRRIERAAAGAANARGARGLGAGRASWPGLCTRCTRLVFSPV